MVKIKENVRGWGLSWGLVGTTIPLMVAAALEVYFAFILQGVIDSAARGQVDLLWQNCLEALVYMGLVLVVGLTSRYVSAKYVEHEVVKLKEAKVNHVLATENHSSKKDLNTQLTTNVEILDRDYFRLRLSNISYGVRFVLGLMAIRSISVPLTLGVAIVMVLPIVFPLVTQGWVRRRKDALNQENKAYGKLIQEMDKGFTVISDYQLTSIFEGHHKITNGKVEGARRRSRFAEQADFIPA